MLGCELWTKNFDSMLALVKKYIVDLWEVRKVNFMDNHALPSLSLSPVWSMAGLLGQPPEYYYCCYISGNHYNKPINYKSLYTPRKRQKYFIPLLL